AIADAAWVTDFHLSDNRGMAAFRCAKRIYRTLDRAAVNGNQTATQARMLAAQSIASMGEEAIAELLALGASPSEPTMAAAIAAPDDGVSALASNDPMGASGLFRGRKLEEIADRRDHTLGNFSKALKAGSFGVKTKTITTDGWTGCWADVFFHPTDKDLAC